MPMRDAFAVLFFVSMGMLLDPHAIAANLPLTLATIAIVLVGKPLAAFLVVVALRRPARTALTVAFGLAQIGEFSFILAALGRDLGMLPERATQSLVVAAIVSITINPLLFRAIEPALRALARAKAPSQEEADEALAPVAPGYGTIIVGYGPVGQTLTRLLRENALVATVIELNHETVERLRAQGIRAIYGD